MPDGSCHTLPVTNQYPTAGPDQTATVLDSGFWSSAGYKQKLKAMKESTVPDPAIKEARPKTAEP